MEPYQNLAVECQFIDGAYKCKVEIYDAWTQMYELCDYVARSGDPAPCNNWILDQIATGAYNPIGVCPLPPDSSAPLSGEAPTVI